MEILRLMYLFSGFSIMFVYLYDDLVTKEIKTTNKDMLLVSLIAILPVVNWLFILSVVYDYFSIKTENSLN